MAKEGTGGRGRGEREGGGKGRREKGRGGKWRAHDALAWGPQCLNPALERGRAEERAGEGRGGEENGGSHDALAWGPPMS